MMTNTTKRGLFVFFFTLTVFTFSVDVYASEKESIDGIIKMEMEAFHRGLQSNIDLILYLKGITDRENTNKSKNEVLICEPYRMFVQEIFDHRNNRSRTIQWDGRMWLPKAQHHMLNNKALHMQGPHDVYEVGNAAVKPEGKDTDVPRNQLVWGAYRYNPPVIAYSCYLHVDPTLRIENCKTCHIKAESADWHITYITRNCYCYFCEQKEIWEEPQPYPPDEYIGN